jgi:hypothetical protein
MRSGRQTQTDLRKKILLWVRVLMMTEDEPSSPSSNLKRQIAPWLVLGDKTRATHDPTFD